MEVRLKELISLGASVAAHCFPCFDFHLEQARKLGISETEIQESIRTGFMVINGAGDKMREKINETLPGISLSENESCSASQRIKKKFQVPLVRF